MPSNAQLASYKVVYRVAQCKKLHTIAEELILLSATDMVSTMIDEATASKLKALSDNTIARCIYAMSKDIEEQPDEKIWHNCFALQIDEVTDSNKECLLIAYIGFIDLLFCKHVTSSATADELFKIIDTYLTEADLTWEDCQGIAWHFFFFIYKWGRTGANISQGLM